MNAVTRLVVLLTGLVTLVTGCTLSPENITLPQSGGSGDTVRIHFESILNLPTGATVTFEGAKVGIVSGMSLRSDDAVVTARLNKGVRLPAESTAEIRSDTVLGDAYVAVWAPSDSVGNAEMLGDGGAIPITQTASPPVLENTLAVLSTFVNGGSIGRFEEAIRNLNSAFPNQKQTRRVARIAAIDLRSLAHGTRTIDRTFAAFEAVNDVMVPRIGRIQQMLNPAGMHYWKLIADSFGGLGVVIPSIGSVFEGGYWLVPVIKSLNGSVYTVRDGIDAVGSNADLLNKFLSDNLFPFLRKPEFKVVSATGPDGRDMLEQYTKLLRMLGAVR